MKTYVKPDLYYENFELSQSVASCSVDGDDITTSANFHNGETCSYDFGITLFIDGNTLCEEDYKEFEIYCYQTGGDGLNFFSS